MTIELERRNRLFLKPEREVLKPGTTLVKETSRIGEEIHIHVLSDNQIEVIVEKPGSQRGSLETTRELFVGDAINKSRDTFNLYPLAKISWRPTQKPAIPA